MNEWIERLLKCKDYHDVLSVKAFFLYQKVNGRNQASVLDEWNSIYAEYSLIKRNEAERKWKKNDRKN